MNPQSPIPRVLVGSAAAVVMSALMIALFSLVPQHEPKLRPNGPARPAVTDGFWEQTDLLGLVDTQWSMERGMAEGEALQYYSNGSLFREMTYRDGHLDGEVREHHEKPRHRQPPVRGRLANASERMRSAGAIRKISHYRDGVPDGPYEKFDPAGRLKESGRYRNGQKEKME